MRIGGKKETEKNIKGRADKNTVYRALFSVLGALLVYEAGKMAGLLLAGALIGGGENAEEMLNSGLTGGLANLIMILTGGLACFTLWKPFLHFRPAKQTDRKEILPFFIMAAALALGLNILMAFLQLDRFSETFREVSRAQADVPLWLGIVLYGLAAPFSEELVFRGIIYGKARDIFGAPAAMVFSGLIFGIYHGNLVQGIYAAFLGTVLAWTMEHTGTLLAPMIFHGIGNITVFLLIDAAGLGRALARPWICAALLFISVVCFLQLLKGGKAGKSQSSIL